MARDNFLPKTKRLLGEASGFNCVRPGCGKPTTAYDELSGSMKSISISAHDGAAAPGGPRYDDSMTQEQRRAIDNGAWLCPTCARVVDVDVERFPLGTIAGWQFQASEYRRHRMHNPASPMGVNFRDACQSAKEFIGLCRKIHYHPWDARISFELLDAITHLNKAMHPFDATNTLCTQFPHMVNRQLQILGALNLIQNEVERSRLWWRNNDFKNFTLLRKYEIFPNAEKIEFNRRIELSKKSVDERFQDFYTFMEELSSIARSTSPPVDLYSW
jgi:hypothetical protein